MHGIQLLLAIRGLRSYVRGYTFIVLSGYTSVHQNIMESSADQ
jgi:hypothetical protein